MRKLLILLFLSLSVVTYANKRPTDDQLKDLCRKAGFAIHEEDDDSVKNAVFMKMALESQKQYDIEKITAKQIDMLFENGGILLDGALRQWLSPVLKKKSENEGTLLLYYYWKYYPRQNMFEHSKDEIEIFSRLIKCNDIDKVLQENKQSGYEIINGACGIGADRWMEYDIIKDVKHLLGCPLTIDAINICINLFNTAMQSQLPQQEIQDIRKEVVNVYQQALKGDLAASRKRNFTKNIDYLNGPFATNTLVGNKAPALNFLWISDGNAKTLDDFKGKVVVLDFWATKCGPCLKLFPEIAKLQEYYNDKDVVIVGVTSIMGYFIDKPNKRTVNTTGHPEKEMELMVDYRKNMGMTWKVAFTKEDVMNVDYGVLGIPHLTILDKNGIVRYNDVTGDNNEKIKLIDNLLKE